MLRRPSILWLVPATLIGLCVWQFVSIVRTERDRLSASIQEGRAIVQAIYDHKSKRGNWPEQLNDLVPEFLPSVPQGWYYRRIPNGELTKHAATHTLVKYYFPPDPGTTVEPGLFPEGIDHGWIKDNEGTSTFLGQD
jgi:hypothetical protein